MRFDRHLAAGLGLLIAGCAGAGSGPLSGPTTPPASVAQTPNHFPEEDRRPLTGEPRITAEISLPDEAMAEGVTVGLGSAWIGVGGQSRQRADKILRVDLATNEIMAEIPVAKAPGRKRITATEDAVWTASSGLLERIDPSRNRVVASVELPGQSVSAIAADRTAVWAVTNVESDGEWTGTLVRVNPATNALVAEIPLGSQIAGYEDEVLIAAGSVWVLGAVWIEEDQAEYGSDLVRIDPRTNSIAARIPVGGFHMVAGVGEMWVRFPADGIFDKYGEPWLWTRVDMRLNEPSEPFEFEGQGLQVVTSEALWSVDYDHKQHVRVTRFDAMTLEAEARSEPIRSYFTAATLDPESGTVWVSAFDTIVRMDIR